jgi:hypothetical protein
MSDTEPEARAAWNQRTVDEEGVERVAKLIQSCCYGYAPNDQAIDVARKFVRAYLGLEGGGAE